MTSQIMLAGAGVIGKRHIEALNKGRGVALAGIIDPIPASAAIAEAEGIPYFESITALLQSGTPVDGIILATPNQYHVPGALETIAAGIPTLVEKPLAEDAESARKLVEFAEERGVPLLTGHHHRYNAVIARARQAVREDKLLGKVAVVNATCWFLKPEKYFEAAWRRQKGGGPILINLIHTIDDLRNIVGEIESVQAVSSNAVRGFDVEDTAVVILRFENGAIGTLSLSDTAVAPWSWEFTTDENPYFPTIAETCYQFSGTKGALSVPDNKIWFYTDDEPGWDKPLHSRCAYPLPVHDPDPLIAQVEHLGAVARGEAEPVMTGREGLLTLEAALAVKASAEQGGKPVFPHKTNGRTS